MTFNNGTYRLKLPYWLRNIFQICLSSWCYYCNVIYCTIVTSFCTIVWQKCHSGTTMVSDVKIWRHNSSTMPQTVEQGMLLAIYVSIDQCVWTINIWHRSIIRQILTYDAGQYGFYGSSSTILTSASPWSILLPWIHKTPYFPHNRSIFVYYLHNLVGMSGWHCQSSTVTCLVMLM